jgi:hypothetical protein
MEERHTWKELQYVADVLLQDPGMLLVLRQENRETQFDRLGRGGRNWQIKMSWVPTKDMLQVLFRTCPFRKDLAGNILGSPFVWIKDDVCAEGKVLVSTYAESWRIRPQMTFWDTSPLLKTSYTWTTSHHVIITMHCGYGYVLSKISYIISCCQSP